MVVDIPINCCVRLLHLVPVSSFNLVSLLIVFKIGDSADHHLRGGTAAASDVILSDKIITVY